MIENPITDKHRDVAHAMRAIKAAVDSILPAYMEDDVLNDTQPASMAATIPMSLDEWSLALGGCAEDWDASADAFANCVAEKQRDADEAAARKLCEAAGYEQEMGGGGCVYMSRYNPSGAHSLITCTGGGGMPTESDFMACFYPAGWDGEEVQAAIYSGGTVTLARAIAAMSALCEADAKIALA